MCEITQKEPQNASCVAIFMTETSNSDAPNVLMNLRELSKILKSLGLPGLVGRNKTKQIDDLLKHNVQGNGWIIVYPGKVHIHAHIYVFFIYKQGIAPCCCVCCLTHVGTERLYMAI